MTRKHNKKADKYEELGGEFKTPDELEEEADAEGLDLKKLEEDHFEEEEK